MIKKAFIVVVMCLYGISCFAEDYIPKVIPAIQNWEVHNGRFIPKEIGTIVISKKDSEVLMETALILKTDLKEMMGYEYNITTENKAKRGDISLSLSKKKTCWVTKVMNVQ